MKKKKITLTEEDIKAIKLGMLEIECTIMSGMEDSEDKIKYENSFNRLKKIIDKFYE